MGLFERLGRNVETFKQEVAAAREAEASHRCRNCGERLYSDPEACPECGSEAIEAVED